MKKLFLTSVLLIPASILALSVTWADYALARAGRDAATVITRKYSHQTRQIWFQGHWGFQYYMESLGAKPVDFGQWMQLPGDLMAYTTNSTNVREGNPEVFGMIETLEFQTVRWLSTMQKVMGASFHSDLLGCTPYQFGSVPPERYQIRLIKE